MQDVVEVPSTGDAHDNDDVVVDDTEGGVILLEANPHRKSALIINTGAATMRVTTDGSEPTSTHGKMLVAGASLSMTFPNCPTKEVLACRQDDTDTAANASEID